jgi:hypothetical protein
MLYRGGNLVRVLNDTGSAIDGALDRPHVHPGRLRRHGERDDDPREQQARPLFRLTSASLTSQQDYYGWVVTLGTISAGGLVTPGSIPDGEIGVGVMQGIAVVDVYVVKTAHGGRNPTRGSPTT